MTRVFISYRRGDGAASAGRIHDRLTSALGGGALFMDVDGIEPGDDFVEILTRRVEQCEVFLAIIGRAWASASGPNGKPRLFDESDFVRIEIAAALSRNVRVIPVLVEGGEMPALADLPEALQGLARRQAVVVRHDKFALDAEELTKVVKRALKMEDQSTPPMPPAVASAPAAAMPSRRLIAYLEAFRGVEGFFADPVPSRIKGQVCARFALDDDATILAAFDLSRKRDFSRFIAFSDDRLYLLLEQYNERTGTFSPAAESRPYERASLNPHLASTLSFADDPPNTYYISDAADPLKAYDAVLGISDVWERIKAAS